MKKFLLEIIVFVCGAVVMAFEILGSRVLGPYVGTSISVWTSIIGVILGSLSLGYWLGGRIADRNPSFKTLSVIIFLSAVFIAISTLIKAFLLNFLLDFIIDIRWVSVIASLILFAIPSILLGMVSPYAVKLKIKSLSKSGSTAGNLYAISTLGSITGTFLAGFYLIPNFKITNILYILSLTLIFFSTIMYLTFWKKQKFPVSLFNLVLILFFIFSNSCVQHKNDKPIKIAISKANSTKHNGTYAKWLKSVDSTIICINMYNIAKDSVIEILKNCSGLLLTGGTDVYSGQYNKEYDTARCEEPNLKRDSLEFLLIENAIKLKMPVLGICRGEQILNVALGGSLIIDIPTDFDTLVTHRCNDAFDCFHEVQIDTCSLLFKICNTISGTVNSNHHQAIDRLADNLRATAHSDDNLIEAIEWKKPDEKSFLLGIQWHPERMEYNNELSLPIAKRFIEEVKIFSNK
ncbi:MAG: fused MFS/spermidine synthase [Bacteroidales bacterium]|nr:fused MFS/spermidine synthase [Bacteroidales bacterium]